MRPMGRQAFPAIPYEQIMNNEHHEMIDEGRRRFLGAAIAAIPGAALVLASREGSAQTRPASPAKEPAVIGYSNKKGVLIERVTYQARNMGTNIAANLFKPP